jgi:hypothetical protein
MKYIWILAVMALLAGCFAPPYLYYGNSSHGYYKMLKKQDAKSRENYQESLEKVFERSARLGIPVPPGLYCDYALLMLAQQRNELALEYLNKEKATWSEAQPFMDFLKQRYGLTN